MKVIFAHGEKGGTGKSTISSLVIDRAKQEGRSVAVVDGDSGVPDVAGRFQATTPSLQLPLNRPETMSAQDAVSQLFEELATVSVDTAVVNLPAAAGETLDPLAQELMAPAAEQLGYDLRVAFAVGPGQESVDLAERSLESGLLAIASTTVAVENAHLGDPDHFAWSASNLAWPGYTFRLPPLLERVAAKVREAEGGFSELAKGLPVMEKLILQRWINETAPLTRTLLEDGEETENAEG